MSELNAYRECRGAFRWQLLTTVSAIAVGGTLIAGGNAVAEEFGRPVVWIDLGGQLDRLQSDTDAFAPPFTLHYLNAPFGEESPLAAQHLPRYGFGGEGSIRFEPKGTDWFFAANVRFGRSNGKGNSHNQATNKFVVKTAKYSTKHKFATFVKTKDNDTHAENSGSQMIVDFAAGKDAGLGLFGRHIFSAIGAGVRIAQFAIHSDVVMHSLPDPFFGTNGLVNQAQNHFHSYYAHAQVGHSFQGVGPTISWNGAAPFVGDPDAGEVTFDWGANAAVLFGRQKVQGAHKTVASYFRGAASNPPQRQTNYINLDRSHSVVVPNVGGFAGLTLRHQNAKVSFGYRADFFFGAMDAGIGARHTESVSFYGPFATLSIGLGG